MADEKLQLDITAKDTASQVVDKLQTKVDKLEKTDPEVDITADAKAADHTVDGLEEQLSKLTASDQVVVLALRAGAAQTELRDLATDLATIDAADPTVDVKFQRYSEVSGQLDDLEAKIRAIGDADPDAGANLEKARTRLDGIKDSAGKADGAVHSFAGNAVGDFASTAAGIGPLGEAVGQLTEGLLAGEIAAKDLAKTAVTVGGIGLAILAVTRILDDYNAAAKRAEQIKAFDADQVEAFTKSLTEGKSAVDDYLAKLREAGEIKIRLDTPELDLAKNKLNTLVDISDSLLAVGASAADFAAAVTGSDEQLGAFVDAVAAAGGAANDTARIIEGATNAHGDYTKATEQAKKFTALFAAGAGDADAAALDMAGSMGVAAVKGAALGTALGKTKDATKALADQYAGLTAKFDDEAAWLQVKDGFDQVREAMETATTATEDQEGATRDARQATLDNIDAVRDYAAEVLGLPPEQVSEIVALIDQGKLDEAEAKLDEATRTRTAWIDVGVRGLLGAIAGINAGISSIPGVRPGSTTSSVVNVTQVLPRGYHGDALGEATAAARRSGGLYRRSRR